MDRNSYTSKFNENNNSIMEKENNIQSEVLLLKEELNIINIEHKCLKTNYMLEKNSALSLKEMNKVYLLQISEYEDLIQKNSDMMKLSKDSFETQILELLEELSLFKNIINDLNLKINETFDANEQYEENEMKLKLELSQANALNEKLKLQIANNNITNINITSPNTIKNLENKILITEQDNKQLKDEISQLRISSQKSMNEMLKIENERYELLSNENEILKEDCKKMKSLNKIMENKLNKLDSELKCATDKKENNTLLIQQRGDKILLLEEECSKLNAIIVEKETEINDKGEENQILKESLEDEKLDKAHQEDKLTMCEIKLKNETILKNRAINKFEVLLESNTQIDCKFVKVKQLSYSPKKPIHIKNKYKNDDKQVISPISCAIQNNIAPKTPKNLQDFSENPNKSSIRNKMKRVFKQRIDFNNISHNTESISKLNTNIKRSSNMQYEFDIKKRHEDNNENNQDSYRTPVCKRNSSQTPYKEKHHNETLIDLCTTSSRKVNNVDSEVSSENEILLSKSHKKQSSSANCNRSLFVNCKTPAKKKGMTRVFNRNSEKNANNNTIINSNNNTKFPCNLGLIGPLSTSIQHQSHTNANKHSDMSDRVYNIFDIPQYTANGPTTSTINTTTIKTPGRNSAKTPARNSAKTPARNFAKTPARNFANTPARNFAKTPIISPAKSPRLTKTPHKFNEKSNIKRQCETEKSVIHTTIEKTPKSRYKFNDLGETSCGKKVKQSKNKEGEDCVIQ